MTELEVLQQQKIAELEAKLAQLQLQLEWLKRQLFGGGKSERQDVLQLQLELEGMAKAVKKTLQKQQIEYERSKAQPQERMHPAERFANVPVKEEVEIIPEEVKANPERFERIGEEVTEEIDITPPEVFKRRISRPKFRDRQDSSRAPILAPAPKRVIEGSYASAGMLAWVAVSKYEDHQPLYRQEKILSRFNAKIARQRLCDWIAKGAEALEILYRKIKAQLLAGDYLQVDESPIKFIDPDQKKGKTRSGYFWFVSRPGGNVYVHWAQSRGKDVANTLLAGFEGVLQVDGYAGYNDLADKEGITRIGCLAHCRRKFADALKEDPRRCAFVLRLIGHLYGMERQWDQWGIVDARQRAHLRKRDFAPTLSLLKKVLVKLIQGCRPGSGLGKACSYMLAQWDDWVKVCDHGNVKLDNNLVENAVRPSALGKKNWLFVGAPEAGKRSAIMYTLILSCKRFGIEPLAYLTDVLGKLPSMTNQSAFEPLLPSNWKPA